MLEERYILWPAYFEREYTRKQGRRVPKKMAVKEVSAKDIFEAVRAMGFDAELNNDSAYPRMWWDTKGRVVVQSELNKRELLKKVAVTLSTKRKK